MADMETKQKKKRGAATKKSAKPQQKKTVKAQPKKKRTNPVANVVYTPAKPFHAKRFALRMGTVAAIVLALVFGISIFFKVETVAVCGNDQYSAWDVMEASGIREGDNLLTVSKAKVASLVRSKLPYVDKVRIGIKLPGTVNIEITELDVVYAINDAAGGWWFVTSEGRVVEKTNLAGAKTVTRIEGIVLSSPSAGNFAEAWEAEPTGTVPTGETEPPVVYTARQQLQTALKILQAMEKNSVLGDVTVVDVADPGNLIMKYGDRFVVELGDDSRLEYKVQCVATAVRTSFKEYDRGTLDASFTLKPNELVYTPEAN